MRIYNTKPTVYSIVFLALLFYSCSGSEDTDTPTPNPPISEVKCEGSISLTLKDIGNDNLNLSWTTNGDYLEYDIEYGPSGFTIGQGTRIRVNTSSVKIQNLVTNTSYDIYARGVCSNNFGSWTTAQSFTTQCNVGFYEGDIFLYTQDDVDSFGAMCYSGVNGDLHIRGYADNSEEPKIIDLSPLANLQEVTGFLFILGNDTLENVDGLEGLRRVGHLYIGSNEKLTSIESLSGIEEIYGELTTYTADDTEGLAINFCPSLTSLEGLQNISSVVRLTIMNNDSLEDLNGLRGLSNISYNADLSRNIALTSLMGLNQLESVGNGFDLRELNSLPSLEGLENLKNVGRLSIVLNQSLLSLSAISNLESVNELFIKSNNNLESLAGVDLNVVQNKFSLEGGLFNDLTGIAATSTSATVIIEKSPNLISLRGLESLETAKEIIVSLNVELTSLSGLNGLRNVDSRIYINNNLKLNNFCALDGLINIGGFSGVWAVDRNLLNPTLEDMQNGICN